MKIPFTGTLLLGIQFLVPQLTLAQVSTTPENRKAVVEEWTGIDCGFCPLGHAAIQQAITNNPGEIIAINFHAGRYAVPWANTPDYRTADGNTHEWSFRTAHPDDFLEYPVSTLNRKTVDGAQVYDPATINNANKIPAVLSEISEVNISGEATIDVETRVITVDVEYYYTADAPSSKNYLNIAVLQNNIQGPQKTFGGGAYNIGGWIEYPEVYNHMHVFRQFMTGHWGDAINNTTMGATATRQYSVTLPLKMGDVPLDLSEIEIVAFINDGVETDGDILTGISFKPQLTGFLTADEVIWQNASVSDMKLCDPTMPQMISPVSTIQNWGSNALTSATITYDINGENPQVMNWTGLISPAGSQTITLNPISFTPQVGTNTMNMTITDPNGVPDDVLNNSGSAAFEIVAAELTGFDIEVNFYTDFYPAETSWEIRNSTDQVVASGGPYTPGTEDERNGGGPDAETTITSVHTLPFGDECYSVRLIDTQSDGQGCGLGENPDPNNDFGIQITSLGEEVFNWDAGGGWDQVSREAAIKTFAVWGISETFIDNISIFPNPATDVLRVEFDTSEDSYSVALQDLQGRLIAVQSNASPAIFDVSSLAAGSYMINICDKEYCHSEKVVIE